MKPTSVLAYCLAALTLVLVAAPFAAAAQEPASSTAATAEKVAEEDKPSAAERRKASSEFEREKLDPSAFEEEEKSSKDDGGGSAEESGSGGSLARALFGLVVVLGVIYGVHWLLKKWGKSRLEGVAGSSGIIDVVATTPLAQGRALHLVRVGEELVLVGATEQSITRIGEVDASTMTAMSGNQGKGEFQAMLSGAMYGQQPGVPAGMGGAGSADKGFVARFLDNLRMTTAR